MQKLLSDIRYARFNSGIARKALGLVYREGRVYPILSGPTRGMKVRFHPGMTFHAVLGVWEREGSAAVTAVITDLLTRLTGQQLIVADVGANLGMYSLLISRLVESSGEIHAFEPSPDVGATLRANVALNGLTNISVVSKACSDHAGFVTFYLGWNHHVSSMNRDWAAGEIGRARAIEVRSITLDDYFEEVGRDPQFIKMDIEGGAVQALKGCARIAEAARPVVYIESHTPDEDRAISDFVLAHRYAAYRLSEHRWVRNLAATYPDPEGVWGHLFVIPQEMTARYFGGKSFPAVV